MKNPLADLLGEYDIGDQQSALIALKEIIQKIVLLGLWRQKFFEHAAFYGGTALRLLYGLPRFSEDLDFSLLKPDSDFSLKSYFASVKRELNAYGIEATLQEKNKQSSIDSAFVKTNTLQHFIKAQITQEIIKTISKQQLVKVKFEVDTSPPDNFLVEAKTILEPIPFRVLAYDLGSLFAGKLHAVLCRSWKNRIKGRDWYDLIWFVRKKVPLNMTHLSSRLRQSGHYEQEQTLSITDFIKIMTERITQVDFQKAKADVLPFIKDHQELQLWSKDFFREIIDSVIFSE